MPDDFIDVGHLVDMLLRTYEQGEFPRPYDLDAGGHLHACNTARLHATMRNIRHLLPGCICQAVLDRVGVSCRRCDLTDLSLYLCLECNIYVCIDCLKDCH